MFFTIIGLWLLVLGIVGLILYAYDVFSYNLGENILGISVISLIIGFMGTIIFVIIIIYANVAADKDIHDSQLEYESIVKQVECINTEYEDVSKTTVIQNVYDWNKEVYNAKYWSENPWTNWFWNKKYVDSLKYIELED